MMPQISFKMRCTLWSGIVLLVFGTILACIFPMVFQHIIQRELRLQPESRSFEMWKKPTVPLYMDIYFFNWTNSNDFLNKSIKPIMQELGPYRFREQPEKEQYKFNNENSTVTYKTKSSFYFDDVNSNGSLDDMITTLNLVSVTAAAKARFWSYAEKKTVSIGLTVYDELVNLTKTARELLFEGYEDMMISMAKEIPVFDASEIPFDKVGWFYMRNASSVLTGTYNVHTGVDDISKLGTIQGWNYNNYNKHYDGQCSVLDGSAGEFFPPNQDRDKPIKLFSHDICRSIPFDYEQDIDYYGIEGYRYTGGERAVDNGTKYPENLCYCGGECTPSGVMNISACRFSSPVFMSFPHYYSGDPFYVNEVIGLKPDKKKHQSYFTLEPTTGATLEVVARFQANFLIRPVSNILLYQNVRRIYMPIMWFEQKFALDEEMASSLRMVLRVPLIGRIIGIIMCIIGIMLCLFYVIMKNVGSDSTKHVDNSKAVPLIKFKDMNNKTQIVRNY